MVGVNSNYCSVLYNCEQYQTQRAKNKIKYIENNYYLLSMHAVFMGTTTASTTPVVVSRRCRVMVFEKPEVVDKTG